jgi:nucleoside-diphosphate-sugar epimerase
MGQMRALVLGAAGFIGMALCKRLKKEGYYVVAVDQRTSPFAHTVCDNFEFKDLRHPAAVDTVAHLGGAWGFNEVYQLACDMGGAGYIFTGEHDAEVMANNVLINTNVARTFSNVGCGRLLYTSSSCVYNDQVADSFPDVMREEWMATRDPSNGYGWEKLFSEKLYEAHRKNFGLNVCITRFSTIYGPGSCFDDGREKAVAAICRKVLDAPNGSEVEVWGDGDQVRPLVYIDDLLDAITRLVRVNVTEPMPVVPFHGPVNIANQEFTTCNEVARQAIAISNKRLTIKNVPGPIGKQVLNMSTKLAEKHLGWTAKTPFSVGLERTFEWIAEQKSRGVT